MEFLDVWLSVAVPRGYPPNLAGPQTGYAPKFGRILDTLWLIDSQKT